MLFIIVLTIISSIAALLAARPGDRAFLFAAVFVSWLCFLPLLYLVNETLPFEGGGDDESYFDLAGTEINSLADLQPIATMEQPGYPWLLMVIAAFAGHDLYYLKVFNLFIFISLAIVWYLIGALLESPRLGRVFAVTILTLSPLWNYFFILRKDMIITFLESLFLLGVVYSSRRRGLYPWLLIGAATIAVIPFRTGTSMVNAAVLVGGTVLSTFASGADRKRLIPLIMTGITVAGLGVIAGDPEILAQFGVVTKHRVIGSAEMLETVSQLQEESSLQRALFPLLYLFSETAGLSPSGWEQFDSSWLRGILAVPWILLVVPFFPIGIIWLAGPMNRAPYTQGLFARLRASRMIAAPWRTLIVFIAAYVGVSWQLGDTTRWRLPDMPVIAAIAVAGWYYSSQSVRMAITLTLVPAMVAAFAAFYLLRG